MNYSGLQHLVAEIPAQLVGCSKVDLAAAKLREPVVREFYVANGHPGTMMAYRLGRAAYAGLRPGDLKFPCRWA